MATRPGDTRGQLLEAIKLATILGFADDVEHWRSELAKWDATHTDGSTT